MKGTLQFRVSNIGDNSLTGLIPISVRLTADTTTDTGDTEVVRFFRSLNLKAGQSKIVKLKITELPAVADGSYHLGVMLDPESALSEKSETNNTAVTTEVFNVATPSVDLSGQFVTTPTKLVIGKKGTAKLTVSNNGNVPAVGSIIVQVVASADGTSGRRRCRTRCGPAEAESEARCIQGGDPQAPSSADARAREPTSSSHPSTRPVSSPSRTKATMPR